MTHQKSTRARRRKMIILAAMLLLAGILGLTGIFFGLFGQELPKNPLRLQNQTGQTYVHMGIAWDGHLLVYNTGSEDMRQAVFPKELLAEAKTARMVGYTADGRMWLSSPTQVEDERKLAFQYANEANEEDSPLLRLLPALDGWSVAKKDGQVHASFSGDTPLRYRLWLLGKGNMLAASGWETDNNPVEASWEAGRGQAQSWLMFKAN